MVSNLMEQSTLQRLSCPVCYRAQTACICQWVKPIENEIEVLILQHPIEVAQAKGTALLLHLCLANSTMVTGEVFADSLFCRFSGLCFVGSVVGPEVLIERMPDCNVYLHHLGLI